MREWFCQRGFDRCAPISMLVNDHFENARILNLGPAPQHHLRRGPYHPSEHLRLRLVLKFKF
jgi:hypothetical protein